MKAVQSMRKVFAIGAIIGLCALAASAADIVGRNIPTNYAGFLTATQNNATGYGNGSTHTDPNTPTVGSEIDALYVCADATDLWIGVTGNLPNKLASAQSIVVLIDADGGSPGVPNVLDTSLITPYGGGGNVIRYLNGTILDAPDPNDPNDTGFTPETAVVVNRITSSIPNCTTYVNSWYLPTGFEDPWDANLVSVDPNNPYNGLYLSAYMDTTNVAGVDDDPAKDGAQEQTLAANALKGLRLRLDRAYYGIGDQIKIMVLLASPGDDAGTPVTYVSNQILPPLAVEAPNGCLTPPFPANFDATFGTPSTGAAGRQYAILQLFPGTPTGFNGLNIPTQWPGGSLIATQRIHTCYGNAVMGSITYTVPGSELDQLFVREDDTYLQIAVSGNLEANGNKVSFFIDADPNAGENTLDYNSPNPPPDPNNPEPIYNWSGRTFDPGLAPEHCYMVNNWQGTFYVDHYELLTDTKTYLGSNPVGGPNGILQGGTNVNGDQFVLDNSNQAGVVGRGEPGEPGDPSTATTGFEVRISLAEIGLTPGACNNVKVFVALTSQNAAWMSNQYLPPIETPSDNIGTDRPPATAFNFGSTAFPFNGNQYATVALLRLGDVFQDANCCINTDDLDAFVQVLLGLNTDGKAIFLSDINKDGVANGADIQPFIDLLLSQSPCP